jgi:8-oxo-dGTP pyrophosphatase MutT (NUDIX family)
MELRPASTVILVRAAATGGIEVFMLRRSAERAFAPNVYVFPGGTVDASDRDAGSVAPKELTRLFRMPSPPSPEMQASLVAAARRELREEAGVTLDDASPLELFSHWITPLSITPRYDVYFFVAPMPAGQNAVADAAETHDGVWIAPRDALAIGASPGLRIIYPTRKHLERIAEFDSVDALLTFARTKPISTVLARGSESEGFALPAEVADAW